jgi:fructosamine-3-kinase
MPFDTTTISQEAATELLRAFTGTGLTVTGMRRLHGGMVNSVLELSTDGEPRLVVAKLSPQPGNSAFERECRVLQWYRKNTRFPVPEPYGFDLSGEVFPGSCLMMERLPGDNLAQVRLSPPEQATVERQMAGILADLHEHKRKTYGSALEPAEGGLSRWLDRFEPKIRREFESVAGRLSESARRTIGRELDRLEDRLPESGDPTLVHGDLWATNIIVDLDGGSALKPSRLPGGSGAPDGARAPAISGFVDGGADYADVEYELAYLLVFHTVGTEFFGEYSRYHRVREGFQRRCHIYWLNTMLLHVRAFGDEAYVQACERLARELEARRNS